jgi:hypothetical protein
MFRVPEVILLFEVSMPVAPTNFNRFELVSSQLCGPG